MKIFKIPKDQKKWKTIPIDTANFILLEAKDYLDYTLNESDKITKRAYSVIIGLGTILTAIVGYTYDKLVHNSFSEILYSNFYLSIILSIFLIYVGQIIFPRNIKVKGRQPKELAVKKLLNTPQFAKEENTLAMVIQEIENIQLKIDFNLAINNKRREKLKIALISIAILFPLYLLIAFFVTIGF